MKKERILELKVYKRRCKLKKKRQKPRKKALAGVFQRINIIYENRASLISLLYEGIKEEKEKWYKRIFKWRRR